MTAADATPTAVPTPTAAPVPADDLGLLRAFEPVIRYNEGLGKVLYYRQE